MTSPPDVNAVICGLLQQLAALQSSPHRQGAYERAGAAILSLDEQVDVVFTRDGVLPKIPLVGPSSLRIVTEVIETGRSSTVERAIADSSKAAEMQDARLRGSECMSLARVRQVLADSSLDGPELADHLGDFQMHSDWSDGRTTLDAMADACVARGYRFSAITDHSHRLPAASGAKSSVARQREAVDQINRRLGPRFRFLAGIEANIRPDGSLDITPDDRDRLEIVVASPHARLRLSEDQTARMVTAVSTPGTHILGHPTGRKWGTRAGIQADWDHVFRVAASERVAIELDGDPMRQDLDGRLAGRALAAGCLFALDSDAHAPEELAYVEFALAHARLAGIPRDRIINCWALEELLAWAAERKRA